MVYRYVGCSIYGHTYTYVGMREVHTACGSSSSRMRYSTRDLHLASRDHVVLAHRKAIVEAVRETWQQVVEERRARDSLTWPSKTWVRWWVRGRRERASFAAAEDEGACFRPAAGGEFHHLFPWAFGWGSGVCSCLRTGRKAKATLHKIYNCRYVYFE